MKVAIIFHSVCGNTYLMAKTFYESFNSKSINAQLFRTDDPNLEKYAQMFDAAKEYCSEIKKIPLATPESMLDADLILLGSPTYFGNVSGCMKNFMDSTGGLWVKGAFIGKKLAAFASAGHNQGGGDLCLQAILIYGQHMGMQSISVPSTLKTGVSFPAYGLLHYSGPKSKDRPDTEITGIKEWVDYLVKVCK